MILNLIYGKTIFLAKNIIIAIACLCLAGCVNLSGPLATVFELPETGVYGRVTGAPAETAWVYAYRSQVGGFRGPADFAARVEPGGSYVLDLVPGDWFLLARSRPQGPLSGPPKEGDAWAVYPQNPLQLGADEKLRIDFQVQEVAPAMLLRGVIGGETGFTGKLLGPDQQPVAAAYALAYRDRNFRRMPDYSSAAAAEDGRFLMYIDEPGRYCLVARQGTRGQPHQGELYGLLGNGDASCRDVKKGQILDVGEFHLKPYMR